MSSIGQGTGSAEDLVRALLRDSQGEQAHLAQHGQHHEERIVALEGEQGALKERVEEVVVGQGAHARSLEDFGAAFAELMELAKAGGALAREVVGGIGELAAGHGAHDQRIEGLAEGNRANGERLAAAQAEREALNGRVDGVRDDVDGLGAAVNAQAQEVQNLQGDVHNLQGQAQALNGRIGAAEGVQAGIAAAQVQADGQLQALQGAVNQQGVQLGAQQADLNGLRANRAANRMRMAELVGEIGNQQGQAQNGAAGLQRNREEIEAQREKAKWQAIGAVACVGAIGVMKIPCGKLPGVEERNLSLQHHLYHRLSHFPSGLDAEASFRLIGEREIAMNRVSYAIGAAAAALGTSAQSNSSSVANHEARERINGAAQNG